MTEPQTRTQYVAEPADAAQAAELARQLGEALTQIAALKRLITDIAAADEIGLIPSKVAIRIAVKTVEAMK